MRTLGNIIIALSLVAGLLAAATAYLPRTDLRDEQLLQLSLAAPAGQREGTDQPLIPAEDPQGQDTALTQEHIDQLRDAGVARVRVKEFAFARWNGRWVFLASVLGLLAGAWMVRSDTRAAAKAPPADAAEAGSPAAILAETRRRVEALQHELDSAATDDQRLERIVAVVGELQQTHLPRLPAARPRLVAQMGLSGYATLMDAYAGAERQLNRAWSAAADHYLEEAIASLASGTELLREAERRLP